MNSRCLLICFCLPAGIPMFTDLFLSSCGDFPLSIKRQVRKKAGKASENLGKLRTATKSQGMPRKTKKGEERKIGRNIDEFPMCAGSCSSSCGEGGGGGRRTENQQDDQLFSQCEFLCVSAGGKLRKSMTCLEESWESVGTLGQDADSYGKLWKATKNQERRRNENCEKHLQRTEHTREKSNTFFK